MNTLFDVSTLLEERGFKKYIVSAMLRIVFTVSPNLRIVFDIYDVTT